MPDQLYQYLDQKPKNCLQHLRIRFLYSSQRLSSIRDLARQVDYMRQKYPKFEVIQDVGSGLNYERRGFKRLLGRIMRHEIGTLAIAERDRLCRFGFELCTFICETFGTTLIVDRAPVDKKPSQDMVEDVMSILHVFSAKMCGKRKYTGFEETAVQRKIQEQHGPGETAGTSVDEKHGGRRVRGRVGAGNGKGTEKEEAAVPREDCTELALSGLQNADKTNTLVQNADAGAD